MPLTEMLHQIVQQLVGEVHSMNCTILDRKGRMGCEVIEWC